MYHQQLMVLSCSETTVTVGSGEITTNKNILQHVKMVDAETDKIEAYHRPGLASAWLCSW